MSVLKNKRGISKLEFYHNARKMRREITELLLREFSVHSRSNRSLQDPNLPDDYYDDLIREFSENIRHLLRNLLWNITGGNTIYPTSLTKLERRKVYQEEAIINCEQIHQEFLYCEDVLPVRATVFVPYIEMLNFEITLLRGWRKSSNKFEAKILEKQKEKPEKEKEETKTFE